MNTADLGGNMKFVTYFFIAILFATIFPVAAQADGFVVGSFCIDGAIETDIAHTTMTNNQGHWTSVKYTYRSNQRKILSFNTSPEIILFSRAVQQNNSTIPTCSAIKKLASSQGVSIILAGRLASLNIDAYRLDSTQNTFLIAPHGLSVTIANVTSGLSKVGGGTLDLRGSEAWIENPNAPLEVQPAGTTGVLQVESWNRTIQNAVFKIDESHSFTETIGSGTGANITLDIDASNGNTSIFNGVFLGRKLQLPPTLIVGDLAKLSANKLNVKTLTYEIKKGVGTVELEDAAGDVNQASFGDSSVAGTARAASVSWQEATAPASLSPGSINLNTFAFTELAITSSDSDLSMRQSKFTSGRSSTTFHILSSETVEGESDFTKPQMPALAYSLPQNTVKIAQLKWHGSPGKIDLDGAIGASALQVAGVRLNAPLPLTFNWNSLNPTLDVPIHLHVGPLSGTVEFSDSGQSGILTGKIERVDLDGTLAVDVTDPSKSKLTVPQNKLGLGVSAIVTLKPFAAGVKPTLAQTGIEVHNPTDLMVSLAGATGEIDITTPTLIMGEPVVQVGEGGHMAPIAANLTAGGQATFAYDLASSKIQIVQGDFNLDGVDIRSLDPTFEANVGNVIISQPEFTLQHLGIDFQRNQPGKISGSMASFKGQKIRSSTSGDNQVSFQGDLVPSGLTIQSISGIATIDQSAFSLTQLDLDALSFGVRNTNIDFGSGVELKNAGITATIDKMKMLAHTPQGAPQPDGLYLTNFRLIGDGDLSMNGDFTLKNQPRLSNLNVLLNGPVNSLSGLGTASLSGFAGTFTGNIDSQFACSDGNTLKVPIAGELGSADTVLQLTAKDGDYNAVGDFAGFGVEIHSTHVESCMSVSKPYHRDAQMAETTGYCPTWSEPLRTCMWETIVVPEINLNYQVKFDFGGLEANAFLTNPRISLAKKTGLLCNKGVIIFPTPPMIVAAYTPQLDDPGVVAQALNALVELVAVPTEVAIFNGLTYLGTTITDDPLLNAVGTAQCIVKGSW